MHYMYLDQKVLKFYIDVIGMSEEQFIKEYNFISKIKNINSVKNIYRLKTKRISNSTAKILYKLFGNHIDSIIGLTYMSYLLHYCIVKPPCNNPPKLYKDIDKYYFKKLSFVNKVKTIFNRWFK